MVRPEILGEAGLHWNRMVLHLPQGWHLLQLEGGSCGCLSRALHRYSGPAYVVIVPLLI